MKRPVSETSFKSSHSLTDVIEDTNSQSGSGDYSVSSYSRETLSSVGSYETHYDVQYPEAFGYSRNPMSICELQKKHIPTKLIIFHIVIFHVISMHL